MPQALKTHSLIHFWVCENSLFSLLALLGNKNWLPSMKVENMKIFWNRMGWEGCKWGNLNAQGTQTPFCQPQKNVPACSHTLTGLNCSIPASAGTRRDAHALTLLHPNRISCQQNHNKTQNIWSTSTSPLEMFDRRRGAKWQTRRFTTAGKIQVCYFAQTLISPINSTCVALNDDFTGQYGTQEVRKLVWPL